MTIGRLLTACTLAFALASPGAAAAAPGRPAKGKAAEPATRAPMDDGATVDAALKAWAAGNYIAVRSLLEPLITDGRVLSDPLLTETALRYLADATLLDESLDSAIRAQQATNYISRLFDADPEWRPPPDTHGQPLYDLYNQLREQYERAKLDECLAERASCNADLEDLKVRHDRLQGDHEALKKAFGEQEIEVREKVARNRALALIPFGVGHFYSGNKALGAGFLAGELAAGGAGLALLIVRNTQCTRTKGFAPESLQCNVSNPEALLTRRDAETGLGITFIGLMVVDVVLAQILFEPYQTVTTSRVRRADLEAEGEAAEPPAPSAPGARKRRQSRARRRDNLQARPHPAFIPGGGGLGLTLRF